MAKEPQGPIEGLKKLRKRASKKIKGAVEENELESNDTPVIFSKDDTDKVKSKSVLSLNGDSTSDSGVSSDEVAPNRKSTPAIAMPSFQAPNIIEVTKSSKNNYSNKKVPKNSDDSINENDTDVNGDVSQNERVKNDKDSNGEFPARNNKNRNRKNNRSSNLENSSQSKNENDAQSNDDDFAESDNGSVGGTTGNSESGSSGNRRRRKRTRGTAQNSNEEINEDGVVTIVKVREPRTREESSNKYDRNSRDGRDKRNDRRDRNRSRHDRNYESRDSRSGEHRDFIRRRGVNLSEADFLGRRENVDRKMLVRQTGDRTQIAVIEDKILVEHYVNRNSNISYVGNIYLGRVQNVLPSMEAAFVDIGKGRNAVLYAGEVNWNATDIPEGEGRKIENVLKTGDKVLVQVTKDPIWSKRCAFNWANFFTRQILGFHSRRRGKRYFAPTFR